VAALFICELVKLVGDPAAIFAVVVVVFFMLEFVLLSVAKAELVLKDRAKTNTNSAVIIKFRLIIPPPCLKINFRNFQTTD
jgi:hypothetical protein